MNKKNSYIFVLVVLGLTLLVLGDYVKCIASAQLLSESVSNSLFGGPATGCEHQCQNGACCDDHWLCGEWGIEDCNGINSKVNTNGKRDWVCKPEDEYENCNADKQDEEECAVFKHCYWEEGECKTEEEPNGDPKTESMTCYDKDGKHTSN